MIQVRLNPGQYLLPDSLKPSRQLGDVLLFPFCLTVAAWERLYMINYLQLKQNKVCVQIWECQTRWPVHLLFPKQVILLITKPIILTIRMGQAVQQLTSCTCPLFCSNFLGHVCVMAVVPPAVGLFGLAVARPKQQEWSGGLLS